MYVIPFRIESDFFFRN